MRSKTWKRILGLVCAGTMMASAVGCGQSGNAAGEEKVEISMIDFFVPGEGVTKAMKPLIDTYLEEHPNVTLDQESVSNADLATKVQTLAAGDELPDIFMVKGQMAETFVENKKMYPLNEMLDSDPQWRDNFKEGVFSNFTIDENIYAVPFQVTNTSVFYNTDLFAQAGIEEFPKTWTEFLDIIPKLKAIGVTPIVLGNKDKWNAESVIMSTLGNRCTGDEWYQSIRDRSGAKFTDEEFVQALQALSDLAAAGAFNEDVNSIDGAQQRQMYMNGKAAMTIDGSWAIANFDENCPDEVKNVTEIAALPMVEGGKGDPEAISGGAGWAIAVNANIAEEKKAVVKDILKAMTGPEYGTAAIKEGTLSAVKPGEEVEITKPIASKFDAFAKDRPFVPVYDHQLSSAVIDTMQSGLQELLIGRVTPQELAERIQTEYENENSESE